MAGYKKREKTDYLVVHCAATPASMDIGVEDIRRWHRQKGWLDVGYHYVIRRDGTVEEGRHVDTQGAHVRGENHRSVGVCMVGGVSADSKRKATNNFTVEQFESLRALLGKLRDMYPDAEIVGHRDLDGRKACPSFNVARWLKNVELV